MRFWVVRGTVQTRSGGWKVWGVPRDWGAGRGGAKWVLAPPHPPKAGLGSSRAFWIMGVRKAGPCCARGRRGICAFRRSWLAPQLPLPGTQAPLVSPSSSPLSLSG